MKSDSIVLPLNDTLIKTMVRLELTHRGSAILSLSSLATSSYFFEEKIFIAELTGVEPILTESNSAVLPLHHSPIIKNKVLLIEKNKFLKYFFKSAVLAIRTLTTILVVGYGFQNRHITILSRQQILYL